MFKKILCLAALMTCLVARVASAGDVLYYGADETPDPEVVARILSGPAKVVRPIKMRSIRLLDAPQAQARPEVTAPVAAAVATSVATSVATTAADDSPSGLGLPVRFAFGSADLLPETMAQLDALAEGIRRTDPSVRVVVEGHTDAVGSPEYNLRLSELRAASVKQYLVSHHRIDPTRLKTLGRGMFAPIGSTTPFAPENRRVEFRPDIG